MAVFNDRENLQTRLQTIIGDRTDDDALSFVQDSLDTYDSFSSGGITIDEHNRLMNEADQIWRQKYRDAFFKGPDNSIKLNSKDNSREDPAEIVPGNAENNPAKFDELFREE